MRRGRAPAMGPCVVAFALALLGEARCAEPDTGIAFFETRIRPVLVEHCYACHSAKAKSLKAGLRLDIRDGLHKGGESGPAVVPGKPAQSLLLRSVRYQEESPRMPPKGKLPPAVVADIEKWIAMGAP